ncbi:MAG: ABC transporter permease [Rhodothermia bacterium]|nr:MAG: ABC transporter permease [Rhodothermia bacterium]
MKLFFFELWESLLIAFRAVSSNKMRSLLTTLGIIIGIVSVTSMATVVNGIERSFEDDMAGLGTDVIYIEKWPWARGSGFKWWNYINRPNLSADIAATLGDRSQFVDAVTAEVRTGGSVSHKNRSISGVRIRGALSTYPSVHRVDLSDGFFYSDMDEQSARDVAVIGAKIADELFPFADPIGKEIRVRGRKFRVIGIFERKGQGADSASSEDIMIRIPYNSFKKHFGVRWRDVSIHAKLYAGVELEDAKDEIRGIVRVARRLDAKEEDNFEINEQKTLREQIAPIKNAIYAIGLGLTALALLVGGIGVMNIMFVTVRERTREIGIRKAVGAKRRAILTQFLIEAVLISFTGGLIGIGLSIPLAMLVKAVLPAYLGWKVIVFAFGASVLIGIVFGLAPAWTAAKSQPIDALRYE